MSKAKVTRDLLFEMERNENKNDTERGTNLLHNPTSSGAIKLTNQDFDSVLASNEVVFILFYTNWCGFSTKFIPVYDELADKIAQLYPQVGKIAVGKVECDEEVILNERYRIFCYPTMKLIRKGQRAKRQYMGKRTLEDLVSFLKSELEDPIKEINHSEELVEVESHKGMFIGYFDQKNQPEYDIFRRVATILKNWSQFFTTFGEAARQMHSGGLPAIVFHPNKTPFEDVEMYVGNLQDLDELQMWVSEKCIPLVREMNHDTYREMAEEQLPFLVLFYRRNDEESVKKFTNAVERDLTNNERRKMIFITADQRKFYYPIFRANKKDSDLPLVMIDDSENLYLLPAFSEVDIPGKLKQFVQDFHTGKLKGFPK